MRGAYSKFAMNPTGVRDSLSFIEGTHKIVKVNKRGKRQERLLKLTVKSLLNIDPKDNTVKNEKMLEDIIDIVLPPAEDGLYISFREPTRSIFSPSAAGLFLKKKGSEVREYQCANDRERDAILEDILAVLCRYSYLSSSCTFRIISCLSGDGWNVKQGSFRVGTASLILFEGNRLKDEIMYRHIQSASLDDCNKDVVWIQTRTDNQPLEFEVEAASELVSVLRTVAMRELTQGTGIDENDIDEKEMRKTHHHNYSAGGVEVEEEEEQEEVESGVESGRERYSSDPSDPSDPSRATASVSEESRGNDKEQVLVK